MVLVTTAFIFRNLQFLSAYMWKERGQTKRDKLVLQEWGFCRWVGNPPKENKVLISKDAQPWKRCSNYRGISLLNSGYKIYTKIIAQCFKTISEAILLEEQNGSRIGRSRIDKVFTIKQTIEKRRQFNLETHMAFLDLEKAFDRVNRNKTMANS